MKRHIVISDPDRQNARLLKALLSKAGYELSYSADPAICRAEISANPPDILITDPLYPSSDGRRLIKAALDAGCGAVIAVSAAAGGRAPAAGGGAFFPQKPFLSGELLARVRACVRRIEALEESRGESVSAVYLSGGLKVEFNSRRVTVDGADVHLTKNEFKILALLCRYSGRVVTGNHIIKTVWGAGIADGSGILRVNIANLRKKIERDSSSPIYLFTESGVGYRMAESEAELTS